MKFLLWGVIVFLLVMWVLRAKKSAKKPNVTQQTDRDNQAQGGAETMLRCTRCGVYIPVSEAIATQSNAVFCSEEHRLQHFQATRE